METIFFRACLKNILLDLFFRHAHTIVDVSDKFKKFRKKFMIRILRYDSNPLIIRQIVFYMIT